MAAIPLDPNGLVNLGSSLVSQGGALGLQAIRNNGEQIRGQYQVELQKLQNDKSLSTEQYNLKVAQLTNDYNQELIDNKSEDRRNTLLLIGGLGALAILAAVVVVVVLRGRSPGAKPTTYTPKR